MNSRIGVRILPPIALAVVFLFFPARLLRGAALSGLAVYALSFAYSLLAARSVTVKRADGTLRCRRNEAFAVSLRIENSSIFGFRGLLVADLTGPLRTEEAGRFLVSMPGRKRTTISYRAIAPERGEFRIGPASLRFSDPLGLFPREIVFPETSVLIVYPETRRIGTHMRSGVPQGALRVPDRAYEDITRFRSIRPYVQGDELRRINWKASARSRGLLTNEYLSALTAPLMIALNLDEGAYGLRNRYDRVERAIEGAASLVWQAAEEGQPVGFATNGTFRGNDAAPPVPPAPGNGIAIMDALARVAPRSGPKEKDSGGDKKIAEALNARESTDVVSLALSIQLPGRCRLAFVGPFPGEATARALFRARENGFSPEIYSIDPGEKSLAASYSRFFQLYQA
jgi:uncharacterized protein (DUF58 family)